MTPSDLPYVGFANKTLAAQPPLKAGDRVPCAKCGKRHKVTANGSLLFYSCKSVHYLAGVNGRSVLAVPADRKG